MYSPLIEIAITTMLEAHGLNRRKAQGGFEATHVLAVGFLVDQFGFGEEAIAAATQIRPPAMATTMGSGEPASSGATGTAVPTPPV